jgi:uncharacterized membrane protein
LNELLVSFATWLDGFEASTALHESIYMYSWIETTHVLTLMVFLGMLMIIDLRMLGFAFADIPAPRIAAALDKPMVIGFVIMVITGFILFFAIPVRTTNSIWFRFKVVLLIAAGINAWLFRRRIRALEHTLPDRGPMPARLRWGAALSLAFWAGVVVFGRAIAYDWFDCHKDLTRFMSWLAGCVEPS